MENSSLPTEPKQAPQLVKKERFLGLSEGAYYILLLTTLGLAMFMTVSASIWIHATKDARIAENSKVIIPPVNASILGEPWTPDQVIGEPNSDEPGSFSTWRPEMYTGSQNEWLRVVYARPFNAKKVYIYGREIGIQGAETLKTVQKLEVAQEYDMVSIWNKNLKQGIPEIIDMNKTMITLNTPVVFQSLVIHFSAVEVPGWLEVDAVGVEDTNGIIHWAANADASSSYGKPLLTVETPQFGNWVNWVGWGEPDSLAPESRRWGPEQATGPADSPIELGDHPTAWASLTPDGQKEHLILSFPNNAPIKRIFVYESFNPGALTSISVIDGDKSTVIWRGKDPVRKSEDGRYVSEITLDAPRNIRTLQFDLDSPAVSGWNEIDAVKIEDIYGNTSWAVSAEASSSFAEQGPRG
jgi:hypothetical protein